MVTDFKFDLSQLRPPKPLLVSEWAAKYRRLSKEDSAIAGKFTPLPYQVEMMDAILQNDTVVLQTSAQVGKTTILLCVLGYFIHTDPCPILLVLPTLDFCRSFSKQRLSPFIRDTKVVGDRVIKAKARQSSSTLYETMFDGGMVSLVGSNSVAGLSSKPIRIVLADEISRFEETSEGDALSLALARQKTFWNRRTILTSTPSTKGSCRVEKAFLESDQRHYFVPCPYCNEYQTLNWENIEYPPGEPEKARYKCSHCQQLINQTSLSSMVAKGKWQKHKPQSNIAGFHLNELYSPWSSWGKVATAYEQCKDDPERLRVWVNTSLGQPYESPTESIEFAPLIERASQSTYTRGTLPDQCKILTCGVDVQKDRLAIQVLGHSKDHTYIIDYNELPLNPLIPEEWQILTDYLNSSFPFSDKSKQPLKIKATLIDSGYLSEEVYFYTRKFRHIHPCKGVSGDKPILSPRSQPIDFSYKGRPIAGGVRLYLIGVDNAKTFLFNRLKLESDQQNSIIFPNDLDEEYFEMLTNEKLIQKRRGGNRYWRWEKLSSNAAVEALDTWVYAYAAFIYLGGSRVNWQRLEQAIANDPILEAKPSPEEELKAIAKSIKKPWVPRKQSWM